MKIIITIILTTLVILFGAQNFDHTAIYLFNGKPTHIRVIFLISIAGAIGYLIRYLTSVHNEEQLKKSHRHLQIKYNNLIKHRRTKNNQHFDDDEY
jgi:uncharacterized integral membrane protein